MRIWKRSRRSSLTRARTRSRRVASRGTAIGRAREAAAAGHFEAMGVATLAPEEAFEVLSDLGGLGGLDHRRFSCCAIDRGRYVAAEPTPASLPTWTIGLGLCEPGAARRGVPYEAPRDPLEETPGCVLAERSWESGGSGRNDSFFALGGSSIKAATLLNRLRRHMSEPVSIVALFEAPTVANLAAYLRERHPDCASRTVGIEGESLVEPMAMEPNGLSIPSRGSTSSVTRKSRRSWWSTDMSMLGNTYSYLQASSSDRRRPPGLVSGSRGPRGHRASAGDSVVGGRPLEPRLRVRFSARRAPLPCRQARRLGSRGRTSIGPSGRGATRF